MQLSVADIIDQLDREDTIEPERKKGKWIKTGQSFVFPEKFRNYSCSECGYDVDKTKFNFCPNCGADMRGGEDA
jgi:rubrerythrin